jgi:FG-GAP repeat
MRATSPAARRGRLFPGTLPLIVVVASASLLPAHPETAGRATQTSRQWAEFGIAVAALPQTVFVAGNSVKGRRRGPGRVHVFRRRGERWIEVERLAVPETTMGNDAFGPSMAVDERTLVVGAQFARTRGTDSGLAYVFERRGTGWQRVAVLSAHDAAAGDQFGFPVSVSGGTIVVGARLADVHGEDSGATYVFARDGQRWRELGKLTASDADRGALFGRGSIDGDTMLATADMNDALGVRAGKAYVFQKRSGGWVETAALTATDETEGDEFGVSVMLRAPVAVIGAVGSDTRVPDSGATYVFERIGGAWKQTARLTPDDPQQGQAFGLAVAVGEDTVIVAAPMDSRAGEGAGAAYVFERRAGMWRQAARLTASDAAPHTWFGSTVAIAGDLVVVGMQANGNGTRPGAAYVFMRQDGKWTEVARLRPQG